MTAVPHRRILTLVTAIGAIALAACGEEQDVTEPEEAVTQDTEEAPDEPAEADGQDVDGSLYADELHDLQQIEVPDPGTAIASLDGEITTFNIAEMCTVTDLDEDGGPAVDSDHDRPGHDDDFSVRFVNERDDGYEDRLTADVRLTGDIEEIERTEGTQVGFASDGDLFTEGAGQIVWISTTGLQAGDGEPPIVKVTEDLEFSAMGEFAPTPGSGEEMRVDFELAGACD